MKNIIVSDDKFFCRDCEASLTIFSENGGQGFRARCSNCRQTYYYPTCEKCDQPTWKHDEDRCALAVAVSHNRWYCKKCKAEKDIEAFNYRDGRLSTRCKECQAQYFSEWYKNRSRKNGNKTTNYEVASDDVLDEIFGGW